MSTANKLLRVFVYGTLKSNEPNHHWLTNHKNGHSKFLSEGCTIKKYPLVIGTRYNIPFLLDRPDVGYYVKGEIYEIDEKMLSSLDILEDYPQYYDREIQEIRSNSGLIPCWVYLIRKFPEEMLSKQFLETYKNTSEKPYCEVFKRDENLKARNDLKFPE